MFRRDIALMAAMDLSELILAVVAFDTYSPLK